MLILEVVNPGFDALSEIWKGVQTFDDLVTSILGNLVVNTLLPIVT